MSLLPAARGRGRCGSLREEVVGVKRSGIIGQLPPTAVTVSSGAHHARARWAAWYIPALGKLARSKGGPAPATSRRKAASSATPVRQRACRCAHCARSRMAVPPHERARRAQRPASGAPSRSADGSSTLTARSRSSGSIVSRRHVTHGRPGAVAAPPRRLGLRCGLRCWPRLP